MMMLLMKVNFAVALCVPEWFALGTYKPELGASNLGNMHWIARLFLCVAPALASGQLAV